MRELSLHILDVVQNSLSAGASLITIQVDESSVQNRLKIEIIDNGKGIAPEQIQVVTDPFYTTRSSRKVGLGLALFRAAVQQSGGDFAITSELGQGTTIAAVFPYDNIDRAPLGNMADTILALVVGNPGVDFCYKHHYEAQIFTFDTRELGQYISRSELEIPMLAVELREYIVDALRDLTMK
jgi:hypothetical protein